MKAAEKNVSPDSEYYIYSPGKTAQRIFLYPVQCGLFTYEPGYTLARNSFDSFLLMYVRKGKMMLDFNGRKKPAEENTFVLIDCYQPHGYSSVQGYECLWLHFDGAMAREYYQLIVSRSGNLFILKDPMPVLRRMYAILQTFAGNGQVKEPLLSRYIYDILTEFMIYSPEGTHARSTSGAVEQAIAFINEHFAEELSVKKLSDVSGLSPYYFIRLFRRETGYTPYEYTVNRRMASARYLLKYTGQTVKEICFSTGYSNESVFCTAFRKQHGMTPQQYRSRDAGNAVRITQLDESP